MSHLLIVISYLVVGVLIAFGFDVAESYDSDNKDGPPAGAAYPLLTLFWGIGFPIAVVVLPYLGLRKAATALRLAIKNRAINRAYKNVAARERKAV